MWSALREVWDVYLGTTEAAAAGPTGEVARFAQADAIAHCLAHVGDHRSSRWRRPRVRVWLSGALARPFLCGPVGGLRRWHEAQALADATASSATGFDGPCSVQLEDWPGTKSALAVAVETATLRRIEQAAVQAHVVIRSIRPWWATALEQASKSAEPPRMLAMAEADGLTVLAGINPFFDLAASYVPKPANPDVEPLLARLTLTHGAADNEIAVAACALDKHQTNWPSVQWNRGVEATA